MIKSILLPIDLNHESSWEKALPQAVSLAQTHGAKIHVLTVIPDFGMSMVGAFFPRDYSARATRETKSQMEKWIKDNIPDGVEAQFMVLHGPIYKEILAAADQVKADMIVMASHRPEMQDYLLGPNAARVVRHATQSVMVVR
jgi:nucleotide-binding universal stress UspA family protein